MTVTPDFSIVAGDDYKIADSRQLVWIDSINSWPTLTGAAITLYVAGEEITGSVVVATGDSKQVQVEVDGTTDTADIIPGMYESRVKAVIAGRTITLSIDSFEVL